MTPARLAVATLALYAAGISRTPLLGIAGLVVVTAFCWHAVHEQRPRGGTPEVALRPQGGHE